MRSLDSAIRGPTLRAHVLAKAQDHARLAELDRAVGTDDSSLLNPVVRTGPLTFSPTDHKIDLAGAAFGALQPSRPIDERRLGAVLFGEACDLTWRDLEPVAAKFAPNSRS